MVDVAELEARGHMLFIYIRPRAIVAPEPKNVLT